LFFEKNKLLNAELKYIAVTPFKTMNEQKLIRSPFTDSSNFNHINPEIKK
jgi:NAD(P)H-dependent flavin oxidoreductase YrpB (nitropropane dioxygenase family)